jgi:hypothetical protein
MALIHKYSFIFITLLSLVLWTPLDILAEEDDEASHAHASHEHEAPPTPNQPELSESDKEVIESAMEECMEKAYPLKVDEQNYCFTDEGSFKACEKPGMFLDPAQAPPNPTASLSLLTSFHKCVYCRPEGNATYNQNKCTQANKDLVEMEQIQHQITEEEFNNKMELIFKDIPEGLVTAVQVGKQAYDAYKGIRAALKKLKDKNKDKKPKDPPPGEEAIGPEYRVPPQQLAQNSSNKLRGGGGATQQATARGSKKGGKFLGFGKGKKKEKKKSESREAFSPGGSGSSGGGSGGGSAGGGGGDAAALDGGSAGGRPYNASDRNISFSGGGGGYGDSGSDSLENQLLGELLSEDNKVKSRLKGNQAMGNTASDYTGSAERTGLFLLLERVRYTTEKTMGEIYIPDSEE